MDACDRVSLFHHCSQIWNLGDWTPCRLLQTVCTCPFVLVEQLCHHCCVHCHLCCLCCWDCWLHRVLSQVGLHHVPAKANPSPSWSGCQWCRCKLLFLSHTFSSWLHCASWWALFHRRLWEWCVLLFSLELVQCTPHVRHWSQNLLWQSKEVTALTLPKFCTFVEDKTKQKISFLGFVWDIKDWEALFQEEGFDQLQLVVKGWLKTRFKPIWKWSPTHLCSKLMMFLDQMVASSLPQCSSVAFSQLVVKINVVHLGFFYMRKITQKNLCLCTQSGFCQSSAFVHFQRQNMTQF